MSDEGAGGRSLATDRLVLRPFSAGDIDALAPIYGDPRVMKIRRIGVQTRQGTVEQLEEMVRHWRAYGFGLWALIRRSDRRLIGECGLHHVGQASGDVQLAYGLASDCWGAGYASEASVAALDHGFFEVGLARVVARAKASNERSHAVLRRLGMRLERTWTGPDGRDRVEFAIDRDAWCARDRAVQTEEKVS